MAKKVLESGEGRHDAGIASVDMVPGDIVERTGANGALSFVNSADTNYARTIVREDSDVGKTINDGYVAGDRAAVVVAAAGSLVNARLTAGQNITEGTYLEVSSGKLVAATTTSRRNFLARESVDATAAEEFILVEVQ